MIDVTCVENALVDVLVQASDESLRALSLQKGIMKLVDVGEQARLLEAVAAHAPAVEMGGAGANVIRGLATLGATTSYSSAVGPDAYGRAFVERVDALGIRNRLARVDAKTGTSVILVTPDGQRTMNTHLGACRSYREEFLPLDDIRQSRWFFSTAYMWDTPGQVVAVERAMRAAKEAGVRRALDVADPFAVDRSGDAIRLLMADGLDVIFANSDEAEMLTGMRGAAAAGELRRSVPIAVVKDGKDGAYVGHDDGVLFVPARTVRVVDTTGAGDMFAAGFLYGLVRGKSLEQCGALATLLASDNIQTLGVRLSADIAERAAEI